MNLQQLSRRIKLMVTRGLVKLIDDGKGLQELQLSALAGELLNGVERLQQYGFTGHPHPGASAVLLNVGSDRSHPIVIAVDDRRYRLHLAEGEVAIYDDLGQTVHLSRSGIVIDAPQGLSINGNVTVTGGDVVADSISLKTHVHGGVQPGGGSTGGPA